MKKSIVKEEEIICRECGAVVEENWLGLPKTDLCNDCRFEEFYPGWDSCLDD
jgi:hypothetical protein